MPDSLTITLPPHMAALVKAKVASGEYATESDVIHDSLLALQARDEAQDASYNEALEHWLHSEAVASYDEYTTNPDSGIPIEEVMDGVRKSYCNRLGSAGSANLLQRGRHLGHSSDEGI